MKNLDTKTILELAEKEFLRQGFSSNAPNENSDSIANKTVDLAQSIYFAKSYLMEKELKETLMILREIRFQNKPSLTSRVYNSKLPKHKVDELIERIKKVLKDELL